MMQHYLLKYYYYILSSSLKNIKQIISKVSGTVLGEKLQLGFVLSFNIIWNFLAYNNCLAYQRFDVHVGGEIEPLMKVVWKNMTKKHLRSRANTVKKE